VAAPNTREVDEARIDSASRYVRAAETFIDSTSSLRIEEEIDIAYPRLAFELRKTGKPGYMALGIARVLEVRDKHLLFDDKFVPQLLLARRIPSSRAGLTASSAGLRPSWKNLRATPSIRPREAACRESIISCCSF
jgi:predicted component of type VI protein secretion system